MPKLAVIVSYCRNERPFIRHLIRNAQVFADIVVLAVGTRLFTGEPEDEDHLSYLSLEFPDLCIARYTVPDTLLSQPIVLHNEARKAGVKAATDALGAADFWALLLDGDEVPDGEDVAAWWSEKGAALIPSSSALKMANYWYFLDPRLVAEPFEDSVLLVHASALTDGALSHPRERDGILTYNCLCADRKVVGLHGAPMFHHYSWVRADRDSLLRKVSNWGHSNDRPWASLLQEQMDEFDAGRWPERDFVHGYVLRRVEPRHQLL
jgi:hypothetical protein